MSDLNVYSYDENTNQLTITIKNQARLPQKIFVKPSTEFGVYDNTRSATPESDYLAILRDEILSIEVDGRTETITFENGSSYETGIYLKLRDLPEQEGVPAKLEVEETVIVTVIYNRTGITSDRRISFEVL